MAELSRPQLAAYAAAALLIVFAGARYLDARGEASAPAEPSVALDGAEGGGTDGQSPGGGPEEGDGVYVHVAGAVRKAGLYRLAPGSRVGSAVKRAGGPVPGAELGGVNLAAELQDGQQVLVPKRGEAPPSAAPASAATASGAPGAAASSPISLSSATVEQLDAGVEGIGPTLAARIIEYRDQNGGFESVEELRQVDGIGEARFAALREAVGP